jgi:hypothetical protein
VARDYWEVICVGGPFDGERFIQNVISVMGSFKLEIIRTPISQMYRRFRHDNRTNTVWVKPA